METKRFYIHCYGPMAAVKTVEMTYAYAGKDEHPEGASQFLGVHAYKRPLSDFPLSDTAPINYIETEIALINHFTFSVRYVLPRQTKFLGMIATLSPTFIYAILNGQGHVAIDSVIADAIVGTQVANYDTNANPLDVIMGLAVTAVNYQMPQVIFTILKALDDIAALDEYIGYSEGLDESVTLAMQCKEDTYIFEHALDRLGQMKELLLMNEGLSGVNRIRTEQEWSALNLVTQFVKRVNAWKGKRSDR